MIQNRRGLIVEVTENDLLWAGGNPVTQSVKLALKGLAFNMAAELRPNGVAAIAITPGFLGHTGTRAPNGGFSIRFYRGDEFGRRYYNSSSAKPRFHDSRRSGDSAGHKSGLVIVPSVSSNLRKQIPGSSLEKIPKIFAYRVVCFFFLVCALIERPRFASAEPLDVLACVAPKWPRGFRIGIAEAERFRHIHASSGPP
jgi:hypothetical protein